MVNKGAVRTVLFGEKQKQRRTISCFAETIRTLFVTLFKQKNVSIDFYPSVVEALRKPDLKDE